MTTDSKANAERVKKFIVRYSIYVRRGITSIGLYALRNPDGTELCYAITVGFVSAEALKWHAEFLPEIIDGVHISTKVTGTIKAAS